MPDNLPFTASSLPPPFECSWASGGTDAACVRVAGELDIATTTRLARTLGEAMLWARTVVLDLRELAFVAGSGVHTILDASRRAREAERRLVVVRGSPDIDQVFAVTGSFALLELHDLDADRPAVQVLLGAAGREVAS